MNSLLSYPVCEETLSFSSLRALFLVRDRHDEALRKEKDRIIAQLCVDLIEKYGWRLSQIKIGEAIPVLTSSGWDYPEIDILAGNGAGPVLLIEALPRDAYAEHYVGAMARLFHAAPVVQKIHPSSPLFLICHTRWIEPGVLEEKVIREKTAVVEYAKFSDLESWDRAGRPATHMIPLSED